MSTEHAVRKATEDLLKHLHECEYEGRGRSATFQSAIGALGQKPGIAKGILDRVVAAGLAYWSGETISLSESGRAYARQVIRAHRLYETYLAEQTGERRADWHRVADRAEHALSPAETDRLAESLGHPRFDPHGDPIPTKDGELPALRGRPIDGFALGDQLRIIHVGDEPFVLAHQLQELELAPGTLIEILEATEKSLSIFSEGRSFKLERAAVGLVHAELLSAEERMASKPLRLGTLPEGGDASVLGIARSCVGPERTRLLDLGFVPGSRVRAELSSPFGSPRAYRVRGGLVALRPRQADLILVEGE